MDLLLKRPYPWMLVTALLVLQNGFLTLEMLRQRDPIIVERVVERVVEMSPKLEEAPEPSTREKMTGPSAYELGQEEARTIPAAIAAGEPQGLELMVADTWARNPVQAVVLARIWVSELRGVLGPTGLRFMRERNEVPLGAHMITRTVLNNRKLLVRETGKPVQGWIGVMRELSPRVTGKYPPREDRGRQQWTSTLPATGGDPPSGWVPERDGDWRLYSESWVLLRKHARRLWTRGALASVPGGGKPRAWDMEGYESKRKRLCKLNDGNGNPLTAGGNWFWGFKGDPACLPVEVALK